MKYLETCLESLEIESDHIFLNSFLIYLIIYILLWGERNVKKKKLNVKIKKKILKIKQGFILLFKMFIFFFLNL